MGQKQPNRRVKLLVSQKQAFPNSCAATSLLCAAAELGVTALSANPSYSLWSNSSALQVSDDCQKRIYQWTSNNPNDTNAASWGYSMPTDIADCAAFLGLEVEILVYSTWTATGLKFGFAQEWNRIQSHSAYKPQQANVSNHTLASNERELKTFAEWQDIVGPIKKVGSLHTVLVRESGSVMDPYDGQDRTDIQTAKSDAGMHGTGLSIILRKT